MLFDIVPLFIDDATEEGRKKKAKGDLGMEAARRKLKEGKEGKEEEVVSRVAARDARSFPRSLSDRQRRKVRH